MVSGERYYHCPEHGGFYRFVSGKKPDAVWEQPCPKCRTVSELRTPPRRGGVPYVRGDVRRAYYSMNLGRWVGSRRDIREGQQQAEQQGLVPMTSGDLKLAAEISDSARIRARDDTRLVEQAKAAGEIESGVEIGDCVLPDAV